MLISKRKLNAQLRELAASLPMTYGDDGRVTDHFKVLKKRYNKLGVKGVKAYVDKVSKLEIPDTFPGSVNY